MVFRAAVLLLPAVVFAQTPPAYVDQALRARVTEFLQYHVEANYRKAFDLVAEDTKDHYFASQKTQYNSFKIDSIKYSDDFTKAAVQVTVDYNFSYQGHTMPVKNAVVLQWKIENDKWMWHYDPKEVADTPMGWSNPNGGKTDSKSATPKLTDASLAEKAHEILNQASIDKNDITFTAGKASSDQVVFHNGYPGSVRVVLDPGEKVPGFRAELDKSDVGEDGTAVLKLSYDPAGESAKPSVNLRLTVEPFGQVFTVTVRFPGAQ